MIMKADSQTPMDQSISLLEYIIKTDGAEHLKIASRRLNTFYLYSIDVILFYVLILPISCFYLIRPVLTIVRSCCKAANLVKLWQFHKCTNVIFKDKKIATVINIIVPCIVINLFVLNVLVCSGFLVKCVHFISKYFLNCDDYGMLKYISLIFWYGTIRENHYKVCISWRLHKHIAKHSDAMENEVALSTKIVSTNAKNSDA